MTAAEESGKVGTVAPPRGCVEAVAPDGATKIWIKPPRGPGPWFRVKHKAYGHRLIQAANEDEALKKYFAEFNPGFAHDLEWCRESMRLNGGRVARLPGDSSSAVVESKAPAPLPAKKGDK